MHEFVFVGMDQRAGIEINTRSIITIRIVINEIAKIENTVDIYSTSTWMSIRARMRVCVDFRQACSQACKLFSQEAGKQSN